MKRLKENKLQCFKVGSQQKQLDDWCAQKKSSENEQTEKDAEDTETDEGLDVDNTRTVEVKRLVVFS